MTTSCTLLDVRNKQDIETRDAMRTWMESKAASVINDDTKDPHLDADALLERARNLIRGTYAACCGYDTMTVFAQCDCWKVLEDDDCAWCTWCGNWKRDMNKECASDVCVLRRFITA